MRSEYESRYIHTRLRSFSRQLLQFIQEAVSVLLLTIVTLDAGKGNTVISGVFDQHKPQYVLYCFVS